MSSNRLLEMALRHQPPAHGTDRAVAAGESFGVGDLLIAALAHAAGALVWSLDGAFPRLERLKLVQCYEA